MTVLTEAALNSLRSLTSDLLASEENTDRRIELLAARTTTRSAIGERTLGEWGETLSTVSGLVEVETTVSPRRAGRTLAEGEVRVIVPFDTDLDGVSAVRTAAGTIYELLPGQDNADESYRAFIELRARRSNV